ncbi:transaldolase [Candidatus Peregrinibacteria bacterium]|nr:transaldolase [Candidatus Peregrinibacteria bacterium]MBI5733012.1 transaldolase [Candidatus Jorgensenbacteria bacterium]
MLKKVHELNVKIFADGAEKASMVELAKSPLIKGFTTNPTLMRKAGIVDYAGFAKDILSVIKDKPISFEVFSDDFREMERQARIITAWAPNVYVKIPITNTKRESSFDLVKKLADDNIKLNVTAMLTLQQVKHISRAFAPKAPVIVSIFAGRIADTGVDPMPIMREAKAILASQKNVELLWASPRELLNIYHADEVGCDIITVTPEILKKIEKVGFDHHELSVETVKMFYDDGQKVGYTLYEA